MRMKKGIVLLISLCVANIIFARTPQEAAAIASAFISQSHTHPVQRLQRAAAAHTMATPVEWAYTQYQVDETTPAVFVFNATNEPGFVLVSAEDSARAVLGYSDQGSFDSTNIPANMRVWLQMYADELARVAQVAPKSPAVSEDYYPAIEPLLGSVAWNQSAPYNNHCPIDPSTNERSVTGCMATATAQIMYHHKYPVHGKGSYSYYWSGNTLSADFANTTYDWANMLPTYKNGYTQVQADAVAHLMYHLGIACNMWYGSSASGAGMGTSMQALINYFDYDAGIRVLMKDYMDEATILAAVISDLQASRPIHIEALTKKREGHAFVCDGMQENGYIHINWGWGGYGNGYFALSAMNPENQGIGGASDNGAFTESVTLYTGIQPNKGGKSTPTIVAADITLNSATALSKKEKLKFDVGGLQNAGVAKESGTVAFLLYKDNVLYRTINTDFSWELKPLYYYSAYVGSNASLSNIGAGEYEMVVGTTITNKQPVPIYMYGHGAKRYQLTVTQDSIFLNEIIKKSEYYGTEYAMMQVTDLSAKTGVNNLRVVVQTEDFALTSKGAVKSGSAMALDLFPTDVNSIIGTYAIDAANMQKYGTMSPVYTKLMALEDGQQVNEVMNQGVVTITQVMGGHYAIDYHLRSQTREFVGKCKIMADAVKCYRQVGSTNKTFTLTNETLTPAPVGMVYDWVSQFQTAEPTTQQVYVQGLVAQIDAMVTAAGDATFSISDNGSQTNALYCPQAKWLAETDFVTGNELALEDTVVMLGTMQLIDMTTPAVIGYVHDYRKGQPGVNTDVLSPIASCLISVQGKQVQLFGAHACDTYIYNLAGEVVAMAPAAERQTISLPHVGCYIVRHGDTVKKMIIQ